MPCWTTALNAACTAASVKGPNPARIHTQALAASDLDAVADIEKTAYAYPWSRKHFVDSLHDGHALQCLTLEPDPAVDPPSWAHAPTVRNGHWVLGYWVAMNGVQEVHLLNITTVPVHRRHGWGRLIMQTLLHWSAQQHAQQLWLEVRHSNTAARALYQALGFEAVGLRKGYYPARPLREDAVVMRKTIHLNPCPLPP